MKEFLKKSFLQKSLAMLFAMFLLGACSTAGERDPYNLADYGYGFTEYDKYVTLENSPYDMYLSPEFFWGTFTIKEATTTYLEILRVAESDTYTYRYSKLATESVLDRIDMSMSNHRTGFITTPQSMDTKYLGD